MVVTVRVALVGGPMYDHLYRYFDDAGIDVEVVVHADHPTLNRQVAALLDAGERLDILATHSKYAPSQAHWLRPLDGLVEPDVVAELAPAAVELCRDRGQSSCLPRLIDVRVMWARTDRLDRAPDTWSELIHGDTVFGFPGRESGLFGTFFELVVGAGGQLFDHDGRPHMDGPEALMAVEMLSALAARAPDDLASWHYDDVDRALLDGRVDAAGAWPGAWGSLAASPLIDVLEPHPYPAGAARRVSYSGCHAWAIPVTCGDLDAAVDVLHRLLGAEAQALDALGGTFCAHQRALAAVPPESDLDRRRREITRDTIERAMITYPPHPRFPLVEDGGWAILRESLTGSRSPSATVTALQQLADALLSTPPQHTPRHHTPREDTHE
jgi:multiple sugar transport system substrate-binding protein